MARPEDTWPPGVFRYIVISAAESFADRKSSWAITMFATSSSMGTPRKMMRSIIRRLNTSIWATFSLRSSVIVGLM